MKSNTKMMVAMFSVMMVGLVMVVLMPTLLIRGVVMGVIMMVMGGMWVYNRRRDLGCLLKTIKKRIIKMGYVCKVDGNEMSIEEGTCRFLIKFQPMEKRMYRVLVMFGFNVEGLNEVNEMGKAVMASHVNLECPMTTIVKHQDVQLCNYVDVIGGAKDFMKMIDRAQKNIAGTMEWIAHHMEKYRKMFPVTNNGMDARQIGFITNGSEGKNQRVVVRGFKRKSYGIGDNH